MGLLRDGSGVAGLHKISVDNVGPALKMELATAIYLRKAQVWVLRRSFSAHGH